MSRAMPSAPGTLTWTYLPTHSHAPRREQGIIARQLQSQLRRLVGDSAPPGSAGHEVELQADYDLEYRYVIKAIAAINGYVDPVTGVRHGLIEKVRLAPLARAAAR